MNFKKFFGQFALLLTAMIWGFAFSAQKNAMLYLKAQEFNAIRMLLGSAFLIPLIMLQDKLAGQKVSIWGMARTPAEKRTLLCGGIACGVALGMASLVQQWGVTLSSAGKSGFLTALYIIMVPILGMFYHRRAGWQVWFSAAFALGGMWLLCSGGGRFVFQMGDILLVTCALLFSIHIMVIDAYAPKTDCVRMSCLQFFTAGVLAAVFSVFTHDPWRMDLIMKAAGPILYCGIFSSGIAYTLQIIGQKHVHPAAASLIMSLESVFSALGGWLILKEKMNTPEFLGCAVIFAAVIFVQIPLKKRN